MPKPKKLLTIDKIMHVEATRWNAPTTELEALSAPELVRFAKLRCEMTHSRGDIA